MAPEYRGRDAVFVREVPERREVRAAVRADAGDVDDLLPGEVLAVTTGASPRAGGFATPAPEKHGVPSSVILIWSRRDIFTPWWRPARRGR
ncbi:hypothetical protein DV26_03900 [Amycolatopsis mediterranei]|nr:hypothetical protein DV26_03900 [Amycolatopsis mediterranei]KDU91411.1 hypothetical protein DV36_15210 [Amycolatopsis mediterranei]